MTAKQWVGTLRGARVGPLYWAEVEGGRGDFSATTADGKTLAFESRRDDHDARKIMLIAKAPDAASRVSVGSLSIDHRDEQICRGTWALSDGSRGIFDLEAVARGVPAAAVSQPGAAQLWNKEVLLGAVTLYRSDLERLLAELRSFVPEPATTFIRATEGGQVIVYQADAYLARGDKPDLLKDMTIVREEIVSSGFKKIVTINLNNTGENNIVVSSPDELWTAAVAQRVDGFMRQFTSVFTGMLRKHGLNVNSLILLSVLIVMPDYHIRTRLLIGAGAVLIILLIAGSHKYIPFARVYLDPDRTKKPYSKEMPSAIMGAIAAAVTAGFTALPELLDKGRKVIEALLSWL